MEITSVQFFAMVILSVLIYWHTPKKFQWIVLLIDSMIFYFANATYYTFIYVLVSVASVYGSTRLFFNRGGVEQRFKRIVLIFTLILNIGILAALKYTNLAIHTFNFLGKRILHVQGISDVTWLAPLAISFYTLQIVSYLLDCYWGIAEPFSNPFYLGLYTIYFPLMISGPICRFEQLGRQLFEEHRFDYEKTKFGLYRIAWGMLKKCAIANRMAVIVDQMWAAPHLSEGIFVWLGTALFIIQLYADFSGCMDIVLGVSACFGISLPENFNAPLYSRSTQEFWRRWHITLGTWLRDYIMNPILKSSGFIRFGKWCRKYFGKKQGKKIPTYLAMLVLWLCMGLWHGNSWKYIVGEGFWFWLVIVIGQVCKPIYPKVLVFLHIKPENPIWHAFQTVRTFLIYLFGMIFFRADSFMDAISRIINGLKIDFNVSQWIHDFTGYITFSRMGAEEGMALLTISIVAVLVIDFMKYKGINVLEKISNLGWKRWILYWALVIVIYFSLNIDTSESIYAQF